MREKAEDLIRKYYAAFNAGDRTGMLAGLADDVAHDVNQGERRIGKAQFASFMQGMDRCYREELRDIQIMSNREGTHVAAEFVVHGQYLASDEGLPPARGQTYVLPAGAFFEVRNGAITRITTYYNLKNWMAQVAG